MEDISVDRMAVGDSDNNCLTVDSMNSSHETFQSFFGVESQHVSGATASATASLLPSAAGVIAASGVRSELPEYLPQWRTPPVLMSRPAMRQQHGRR